MIKVYIFYLGMLEIKWKLKINKVVEDDMGFLYNFYF